MNEKDFLNVVLQAAGTHPQDYSGQPSEIKKSWDSGEQWEIAFHVQVWYHLSRIGGVKRLKREHPYSESKKSLDIYFEYKNKTYAVEFKVESPNTNKYGGYDLDDAIRTDVEKLKAFQADFRWMVVVSYTYQHKMRLAKAAEWSNALFIDFEGNFAAFLCNVDKYPNGHQ